MEKHMLDNRKQLKHVIVVRCLTSPWKEFSRLLQPYTSALAEVDDNLTCSSQAIACPCSAAAIDRMSLLCCGY
jgi:hypothetical protein